MDQPLPVATTKRRADNGGVTVVVPALQSSSSLAALLNDLRGCPVVVVDGGSTDATAAIAARFDARLVRAPKGRGRQLSAGADSVGPGWLLFLHSDTRLAPEWRAAVDAFIGQEHSRTRAAVFALRLDDNGLMPRVIEAGVHVRTRVFGLPYGDQGLLIHRTLYDALGGYAADLPLMEDIDLVRRVGWRRIATLGATATTSAARYRRDGYVRRVVRNLACLAMYFAGTDPARLARFYEE